MGYETGFTVSGVRYSPSGVLAETRTVDSGVASGDVVNKSYARGSDADQYGGYVLKKEADNKASVVVGFATLNIPVSATLGAAGTIIGLAVNGAGKAKGETLGTGNSIKVRVIAEAVDANSVRWAHVERL